MMEIQTSPWEKFLNHRILKVVWETKNRLIRSREFKLKDWEKAFNCYKCPTHYEAFISVRGVPFYWKADEKELFYLEWSEEGWDGIKRKFKEWLEEQIAEWEKYIEKEVGE